MNRRTALRIGALASWLLAVAPVAATYGADAAAPEHGWWNRQQAVPVQGDPSGLGVTTVPTVPAPATVPEDGLYVAADPSGASAISALRYAEGGSGTLTLLLPEGTTLTGTEKVVACPVQGGFTPVQNGAWASRPAYDPATCTVEGTPASDGSAFTFEIPSSFASAVGDVQIVIAPAADAAAFSLPFDEPTADSFAVAAPASAEPSTSSSFSYDAGSASYSAPVAGSAPSFSAPSSPTAASPSTPSRAGGASVPVAPAIVPAATRHAGRTDQVVAVVLLALIGGAFWFLSNRPQRLPRLLGSVGGQVDAADAVAVAATKTSRPRGVGRFARHRTAPPTAI